MDEDFVDDDLGEQRRQQCKELQEERSDQHLAQMSSIFDNRRNEPRELKLEILQAEIGPLCEEEERPGPGQCELLAGEHERARLGRILDKSPVTFELGQYDIPPVRPLRDRRKRCTRQLAPLRLEHAGLESKMF